MPTPLPITEMAAAAAAALLLALLCCALALLRALAPSQWRCWDGANFSMQYRDPYLYPAARPEDNFSPPLAFASEPNWYGNVVWSGTLEKFVFVCSMKRFKPGGGGEGKVTGIAYMTSTDLMSTSTPGAETPAVSARWRFSLLTPSRMWPGM